MPYTKFYPFNRYSEAPQCFKISGQVTKAAVPQSGAIVYCVDEQLDILVAPPKTTDGSGNYSFAEGAAIRGSGTYHITAQYDDGNKWNSLSQPYVVPVAN